MHVETDGSYTFSHTSISLWRLCKRRWAYRYILKNKEPESLQAAWSVWMVHKPQEWAGNQQGNLSEQDWQQCYDSFRKTIEVRDDDDFHTVGTGKRLFERIRNACSDFTKVRSEEAQIIPISGKSRYYSRPDVLGTREGRRFTMDIKYTEGAWRNATTPWPVKELLAYDDQLLGQAISAKADGFIRTTIQVNAKNGQIAGPTIQEKLVDGKMHKEWSVETAHIINEIERTLEAPEPVFQKNTDACFAFGKACFFMNLCKQGWRNDAQRGRTEK